MTPDDWSAFALLLIDVQRDFRPAEQCRSFPDFPRRVGQLLSTCRDRGIDVIHLRGTFRADRSDWMPRYRLRGSTPCVDGTEGIETLSFAVETPGEPVIAKQTFDGFHQPELLVSRRRNNCTKR